MLSASYSLPLDIIDELPSEDIEQNDGTFLIGGIISYPFFNYMLFKERITFNESKIGLNSIIKCLLLIIIELLE